ncbi:MAG: hypothetical protein JOZ73_13620 [Solirubrobacterales bacterium]|nr:hypothetical protein [Solirubrobacterales bacterium]
MRRSGLIVALLLALALPALAGPAVAHAASGSNHLLLARAGGGRGGFSRGGGGFHTSGHSLFGSSRSRRSFFRRVARSLALAYIFHLFFSHGGLSILLWIVIIALLVMLWRRRRRRRYAY